MAVLHSEDVSRLASSLVVFNLHDLTFTEVIASAVRSQLLHLAGKFVTEDPNLRMPIQSFAKSITSVVMAHMKRVLTTLGPFRGNSELRADGFR